MLNKNNLLKVLCTSLVSALALTACGGGGTNGGEDNAQTNGGKTIIKISSWYRDQEFDPVIKKANEMLAKDNIEIEYTYIALDQYNTWLSAQLQSGSGPDLVMDGATFPARIKAQNLLDVTDRESVKKYNEAGLALALDENGKKYGIPTYGWFSAYFYNKDLFKKYNVEPPKTFDDLLKISKTFKEHNIEPIAFGLSGSDKGLHSMLGYLENAYYHNGSGSTKFDTEFTYAKKTLADNWIEPVTKWKSLIDEGVITTTQVGLKEDQAQDKFVSGKAAMVISGPWDYKKLKDANVNFGVFGHVGNSGDQYLLGGPAGNIGVNKDTKHKEAALKAFDVMASAEVQKEILKNNPGAFSYAGVSADMPEEYELIQPILDKGNIGNAWDRWAANMPSGNLIEEIEKQQQSLISGQIDVKGFLEALDSFAATIRYE